MALRALAATALLAALACGLSSSETYEVTGVVEAVDPDHDEVRIAHDEIPGFMPAMTMNFEVATPALLEGLAAGDPVVFTLEREATLLLVTAIAKRGP